MAFSSDIAWLAEFAKFKHPVDVWNNLQFGMRERRGTRVGRQEIHAMFLLQRTDGRIGQ